MSTRVSRAKVLVAFSVIAVIAVSFWLLRPAKPPAETSQQSADSVPPETVIAILPDNTKPAPQLPSEPVSANTAKPTPKVAAVEQEPAHPMAELPEPSVPISELPNLPQETVSENVRSVLKQYRDKFGGNPVGTNQEITEALNGGNKKQTRFLSMEDGMRLNNKGELVDTWGTPYFFHQLSGTEMEIHSAGPDKKMWTSDDLVIQ